ncbi:MAG: sarcosine oxidase subunit gamma family protein [Pseudomonadota bacterium]|nr:sarcosine oxidase subunit gamma family protein [Pseudomonadota bacterium]
MDSYEVNENPLDSCTDLFKGLISYGLNVETLGFLTQINLRADISAINNIRNSLDLEFALVPNQSRETKGHSTLCLGPDEWLVVGPLDQRHNILSRFENDCGKNSISVVDVSFNRVVIEIGGRKSIDLLSALTSLSEKSIGPGSCAQTLMAKAQVILHWIKSKDQFRVYVRSSFSRYLADVIIDQSRFMLD